MKVLIAFKRLFLRGIHAPTTSKCLLAVPLFISHLANSTQRPTHTAKTRVAEVLLWDVLSVPQPYLQHASSSASWVLGAVASASSMTRICPQGLSHAPVVIERSDFKQTLRKNAARPDLELQFLVALTTGGATHVLGGPPTLS